MGARQKYFTRERTCGQLRKFNIISAFYFADAFLILFPRIEGHSLPTLKMNNISCDKISYPSYEIQTLEDKQLLFTNFEIASTFKFQTKLPL